MRLFLSTAKSYHHKTPQAKWLMDRWVREFSEEFDALLRLRFILFI